MSTASASSLEVDIVIAGAGMVGSCAALALAQQGYRIALIEAAPPAAAVEPAAEVYDLRVSAISPTSQQFLGELGVWQGIDQTRVCHYSAMHIWHQPGDACIDFDSSELARSSLGCIVENREILLAAGAACRSRQSIEWFRPDTIISIDENSDQGLSLRLSSGPRLRAELLIIADGRFSPTRQLAGFDIVQGDYAQTAIVANVTTQSSHRHTAWQRFLQSGPLAFLPLANGQSSIVWSCDSALAARLLAMSDDEFCAALTEAFQSRLGSVHSSSGRQHFRLGWHSCEHWLKSRALLIGDAAHSVHPLAGQGVNLGFSDVQRIAELMQHRSTAWNKKILRRFERERKSQTLLATHVLTGLKWIYAQDNAGTAALRDAGMNWIQSTPWWRRKLMQQAMHNMN